jgi:DNA-directed RNA polymerase subunit H (RpoH/RPB5)
MIRDRGYSLVNELNEIDESALLSIDDPQEFVDFYVQRGILLKDIKKKGLTAVYSLESDEEKRIYVSYPETIKGYNEMPSSLATEALNFAFKSNIRNVVLISAQLMKPKITKVFSGSSFLIRYTLFQYEELVKNRTKNFRVPRHELLPDEEKQALLQKNSMQLSDFPAISIADPQSKYYGAVEGDVFRIYRYNFIAPSMTKYEIAYRVVVNRPLKAK